REDACFRKTTETTPRSSRRATEWRGPSLPALRRLVGRSERSVGGLPLPPARQAGGDLLVAEAQDRRGEQRGIDRAGPADGQCADGDAGRHLDHREQAIEPAQRG